MPRFPRRNFLFVPFEAALRDADGELPGRLFRFLGVSPLEQDGDVPRAGAPVLPEWRIAPDAVSVSSPNGTVTVRRPSRALAELAAGATDSRPRATALPDDEAAALNRALWGDEITATEALTGLKLDAWLSPAARVAA